MLTWIATGCVAVLLLAAVTFVPHSVRRRRLYRELAARRLDTVESHKPGFTLPDQPERSQADFQQQRILRFEDVLSEESMARLVEELRPLVPAAERSYLPGHKKGGTISYERIHSLAPHALAVYHSEALRQFISGVIGQPVYPTADHDQSSCSILCYDQEGDHINWHYDHNFYHGRHFTVLLSVINSAAGGGPSSGKLMAKKNGEHVEFDTSENTLVVFEGAKVIHRATRTAEGDLRLMLSMTFGTDPHISPVKEVIRRVKDTAYYGLRALWD